MKKLQSHETAIVSGGGVSLLVPIDSNTEFNFSNGFNAGIDFVGGIAGFTIGVVSAFVVLPAKGVYTIVTETYSAIHNQTA